MQLYKVIHQIHRDCFYLCKMAYGNYLPVAGNIGVFCQSDEDYKNFLAIKDQIAVPSSNPKQKYFKLNQPITMPRLEDIPETSYDYLYIRTPASDTPQLGDVDFVLSHADFAILKRRLLAGEILPGIKIYDRSGWDMIEVTNPTINSIAYITYKEMAEKIRIRFE